MTGCLLISVLVGWTCLYDGFLANMVKSRPDRNSLNRIQPDTHRISIGTATPNPTLRSSVGVPIVIASCVVFPVDVDVAD